MSGHGNRGGETPGHRERMDGMTRQLVQAGNSVDYARRVARDCALRSDGDRPGGPSRRNITEADRQAARERANRSPE